MTKAVSKPVHRRMTQAAKTKQFERMLQTAFKDEKFVDRIKTQFLEAAVSNWDDDDPKAHEFRRLTSSKRDVSPLKFEQAMKFSFYQWQRNPLAQSLIRIMVDFCVGDDLAVKVKIKKRMQEGEDQDTKKNDGQQLWDDFYSDPVNKLETDLKLFVQDLLINGELVVPVNIRMKVNADETREGDGLVRLGYMDPLNIKNTVTDPGNIREVMELVMMGSDSTKEVKLKVIRVDIDPNSATYEKRVGETFYWRINYVTNQTRGNGELVPLLDWLDALDQFLFDALEGFRMRNAFFYQLEMGGLNQKDIEALQSKIKTPKSGTTRVVNDKAKWTVVNPQLGSYEVNQSLKTFLAFVVGVGKNMPLHWFGTGDDANLASAKVMTLPTMRMLRALQRVVRGIVKDMVYFVTDQAILAKTLTLAKDEYVECDISMFDFEKADSAVVASAMVSSVTALSVAVDRGWISENTARKIMEGYVTRLGVEIDPDDKPKDGLEDLYDKNKKKIPGQIDEEDDLPAGRQDGENGRQKPAIPAKAQESVVLPTPVSVPVQVDVHMAAGEKSKGVRVIRDADGKITRLTKE